MALNIAGLCAVVVFYCIILVIGIIASRKTSKANTKDEVILADRSIGLCVSFFTITATMVGGGYINGTAESVAFDGFVWTQAPLCYCIALFIGGIVYAPKMRKGRYVTMFDPFQLKYGRKVGALLFIPQLLGDIFWSAAILAALGNTMSIILDFDVTWSIVISASVAVLYTFMGGLYSVAYTDVIQLFFIAVGLFLVFPFAMSHQAVDLSRVSNVWFGTVPLWKIGLYIDTALLLIMGGIPWQTYYQRVLACTSVKVACVSSILAAFASLILALPPCVIGVVGAATDWNQTSYTGEVPLPESMRSFVMPLVLQYLCPVPVSIIGIGAVSAAVMSSADSCVLSSASIFTKNIYCDILRTKASDLEMVWVLRVSILVTGVLATAIAVTVNSIYGLYVLCSDLMYVILFPQLTCVLWFHGSNAYGCLSGYLVGSALRLMGGESVLHFPALVHFPLYDPEVGQLFPFRTLAMLCSLAMIAGVSHLTNTAFTRGWLPARYDVLHCLRHRTIERKEKPDSELVPMMSKNPRLTDENCQAMAEDVSKVPMTSENPRLTGENCQVMAEDVSKVPMTSENPRWTVENCQAMVEDVSK